MNSTTATQDNPTTSQNAHSATAQLAADPQTGDPLVYSPQQAADALCVSVYTVRRMANRRELPHVRVGNQIRIPAAGLRSWLKTNTVPIR